MRTAPKGGTRGQNRSVFAENRLSLEPHRKPNFNIFSIVFGPETLLSVGSLTNKTGPQPTKWPLAPPQNGHILGPRDTWDPKQGSLYPCLACDQMWSAGVSPRTAPKTGKIHFLGVFSLFCALGGRKISQSPRHPKTSGKPQIAAAGG